MPPRERDLLPPLVDMADVARAAPAWLLSAIVHIAVFILLALAFVNQQSTAPFVLSLDALNSGDNLAAGDLDVEFNLESPSIDVPTEAADATALATQTHFESIDPPTPIAPLALSDASAANPMSALLSGRSKQMSDALLRAYGGDGSTQNSVMEALRWLVRNQDRRTGLWSLTGPYSAGRPGPENKDAATALALLAFQGAGYTPLGDPKDPFTPAVHKAWKSLLKRQDKEGHFFQEGTAHDRLYTHAIATIALCELYGMTRDSTYRDSAQLAVKYCVDTQAPEGGWRYTAGIDSDLSVTGWFAMALQSARMAGLDVPTTTLHRLSEFLDLMSRDGGAQYAYHSTQVARRSMSAEGLLCRQYLGWQRTDLRLQRGAALFIEPKNLPSWDSDQRDCYYWYYATQVCHNMEGDVWRAWNAAMRKVLPENQVREGRERGSWDPADDEWGSRGGRLMITCLHTYMLEVYYRHLPIYRIGKQDEGR